MLRTFTPSDFSQLSSWVTSEELLLQFSATAFPFPLKYSDMQAYMDEHPDRRFYMASDTELGDYGFGEIIPQPGNAPRLGRLLIGEPTLRGKGLGKKLISLLLDECRKTHAAAAVELFVLTDNYRAIKCYENMGFNFIEPVTQINLNGTIKTMKKMRIEF